MQMWPLRLFRWVHSGLGGYRSAFSWLYPCLPAQVTHTPGADVAAILAALKKWGDASGKVVAML